MKRSGPLARGKPLARTGGLRRTKRLRARGDPVRRARVFARCYGDRGARIRELPCLVCGCGLPTQAAHARARGMGGAKGDRRDLVPLCAVHHAEAGEMPGPGRYPGSKRASFEARHGLDLQAEAARLAAQFDAEGLE